VPSLILAHRAFLRATVTNFFFFSALNGFVLLPLYIQELGGSVVAIGVVMGLYSGVGIVCQPLIGPWIDALGRKPFMVLGVGLALGTMLVAMLTRDIAMLGLLRALQGVAFSAFFVANYSFVIDLVPPAERGWALGIYGVSGLVGTALTPLVGEGVIRWFGFRTFFGLCAALAIVAAVLIWRTQEPPRERGPRLRGWSWARAGVADLVQRHMAVTIFFGLGAGALFTFVPTFGESLGVATLALFYTAYAGAAMAVRIFGGRLIDTRGRRAVIVPSMFVQTFAVALLAGLGLLVTRASPVPVSPVLFVAGLLAGGAHGFMYPGLAAIVADQAADTRRGAVVGVFSAVYLTGNAAGAFVFGYVTHAVGYGFMWAVLTAVLLAGAGISLRLRDRVSAC
jgi:MFS family permease